MANRLRSLGRKLLILPPLFVGIGAVILAVGNKPLPAQDPAQERASLVRILAVPKLSLTPRVLAHGVAQPGRTWQAVAEVSGRVTMIHPQLKKGALVPAGTELIGIDRTDYELILARLKANRDGLEAQLKELEVEEANSRSLIAIETRNRQLAEQELERKRALRRRGSAAQATVDEAERSLLSIRQNLQSLRNTLSLIPTRRTVLQAELAAKEQELLQARQDLARTLLRAPFPLRIAEVNVEEAQYVAKGAVLASADGIQTAEVTAQLPLEAMFNLLRGADYSESPADLLRAGGLGEKLPELMGLTPTVRARSGSLTVTWPARLARVSDTIDPNTRTLGVIVAVDAPYAGARPGVRPPLVKNMFVEVEIAGHPQPDQILIPRAALHDGKIYKVNADDRLVITPVEILYSQGNIAVIASGLAAGERIVLSDLIPAIDGMKLDPHPDADALARLQATARGEGAVR